jgi:SAM-dependent methyltransferase
VVLETSPRLGKEYREVMASRLNYRASDFEQVSHTADLTIDLQDIDLPTASLDVVLTPHVLEHVPDTYRAARELYRVVRPGGVVLLQVPLLQPRTGVPPEPEYHEDHTLVYWRFGLDLTSLLREAGFEVAMLVTQDLADRARAHDTCWPVVWPEFDAPGLITAMTPEDLTAVASRREARRMGFVPSYMFVTWECRKASDRM